MKKFINYGLVVIGLIILAIVKQNAKKEIRENAINNVLETENIPLVKTGITEEISTQTWFTNTQFGLAIETPKKMVETPFSIPRGTEEYISDITFYVYKDEEMAMNYMIMDTKYSQYDTKEGLRGSVSNLINTLNGTNLNMNYFDIENKYNDKGCEGTCMYKTMRMKIRGYCLFNGRGRVYMLIASGPDIDNINNKMDRIFNSIRIINIQ